MKKIFLSPPRRGEVGKRFSTFATSWGSRKKIFYVRHAEGKSEKNFLRSPRRGEVGKRFSTFATPWGSQKKIFHVPRLSEQLHED